MFYQPCNLCPHFPTFQTPEGFNEWRNITADSENMVCMGVACMGVHERGGATPRAWGGGWGEEGQLLAPPFFQLTKVYYAFAVTPHCMAHHCTAPHCTAPQCTACPLQVSHHLTSLEAQLTEVYHAFALAYTLNRTLIMPRVSGVGRGGGQSRGT